MQEKQKINIVWFRNDLRTIDNPSLYKASGEELPFLAVLIIDTDYLKKQQFGFKKLGKFRAKFLLESIEVLKENLEKSGIPFLTKIDTTEKVFKELASKYQIEKVFLQKEWTPEEEFQENKMVKILQNTQIIYSYGQFLIEPELVKKSWEKIPAIFTNFRKKIENQWEIRAEFACYKNTKLHKEFPLNLKSDELNMKGLGFEEFKTHPNSAFPFSGGENEAWKRLKNYFFEQKHLMTYKETRNGLIGSDYSTKFSAWLANGCISTVSIYHQIKKFEVEFGGNDSTNWLVLELLWRDYFKYISLQHGHEIFKKKGIKNKDEYHLKSDEKLLNVWKNGKTKSDFVNANMIDLRNTGFMSNRGRQNAASYFCKTMKIDWRIGAAYFEEMLLDYDVHSNYGNWMYVSGVGNDPRNRIFNPEKQAEMYDADKSFRTIWNQPHMK